MKNLIIALIKLYQVTISPFLGTISPLPHHCRFTPTCSQYTINSIQKYGITKGLRLGLTQLSHCHPFNNSQS